MDNQSVMDGSEFLNRNPCMPPWPGVFPVGIFWELLWVKWGVFWPFVFPPVLATLFSLVAYRSGFFVIISTLQYFAPKFFASFASCYGYVLSPTPLTYQDNFFSCSRMSFFDCIVWSYLYLISLFSFAITFWFISSNFTFCSNCVALLFSSQHILTFYLYLCIFCLWSKISYLCFQSSHNSSLWFLHTSFSWWVFD